MLENIGIRKEREEEEEAEAEADDEKTTFPFALVN